MGGDAVPADYAARLSLMTAYCSRFKGEPEVPDPYYGGPAVGAAAVCGVCGGGGGGGGGWGWSGGRNGTQHECWRPASPPTRLAVHGRVPTWCLPHH